MALYDNQKLFDAIKDLKVISDDQLKNALEQAEKQKLPLGDILLSRDLISPQNLGKVLSDLTNFPFVNLSHEAIDQKILNFIPELYAKANQVIAFRKDETGLHLALTDPSNKQVTGFLNIKTGIPIKAYLTTKTDIQNSLSLYTKDVKKAFKGIIDKKIKEAKGSTKAEAPIIKIVDTIFSYAYQNKASDIHIEPLEEHSLVRFRVDGILHDVVKLPLDLHQAIITRIKVLAKLRTDEHQAAQDGKAQHKTEAEELDIRVSIVPITEGEKVVMRLLSERSRQFSLADLGFSPTDLIKVEAAYKKPHGMILSTGPTGSGKTTSLYAILKLLNKRNVNLMTIEDPVEYDMEGVNQIQVNKKTNLTFSKGLRSIVRQDPDIILVGEIRDQETASIAINSAMTGHLVLSTLHTNDAATSIPRLFDMKVEPFLVASTVNIIIAQRLVRKLCQKCRISKEVEQKELATKLSAELIKTHFNDSQTIRMYFGKGCPVCHNTGYMGRIGIFEVLIINDSIREAVVAKKTATDIKTLAVKAGMTTMLDDGLNKVKNGLTTLEEIIRVTKE